MTAKGFSEAAIFAWIFIRQPRLALKVRRARKSIPELCHLLNAIEVARRGDAARSR